MLMEVYIPHITKNDIIILIITTLSTMGRWLHLVGDEKCEAPNLKIFLRPFRFRWH